MTGLSRLKGFCIAAPLLLLTSTVAHAASHDCPPPRTSDFTQAKAQELFQNRANPDWYIPNPKCFHDDTYSVFDSDGTYHENQNFPVGANPGDERWLYRKQDATGFTPRDGIGLEGFNSLLELADGLPSLLEENFLPSKYLGPLESVTAEYGGLSAEAVDTLNTHFSKSAGSPDEREVAKRNASEAINTLLALSNVSVTCQTLESRPKFKQPICSSVSGGFDLRGCQLNYNVQEPVRKRGIVRVVWYTIGHGGTHSAARESKRYECDNTNDRNDLEGMFSRSAFRQLCRREDYDIPYQTVPSSC